MNKALQRLTLTSLAALAGAVPASASFLDSDFWCRTYGCAVVYDSQSYEIYDNYQFATGRCCIAYGSPMPTYYNPIQSLRTTGTTDIPDAAPQDGEGFGFDIIDGSQVLTRNDDGDGYLDASDSFSAFTLSSETDLRLDAKGQAYSHSFWITSRNTRFSLRARASISDVSGDFANTLTLGDIKLDTNVSTSGNDNGFQYGSDATGQNVTILNGIDDLGDLASNPTRLINFGRFSGVRTRNGDLADQTIRIDFNYRMPDYDMSMGIGEMNVDVVFDFYRER